VVHRTQVPLKGDTRPARSRSHVLLVPFGLGLAGLLIIGIVDTSTPEQVFDNAGPLIMVVVGSVLLAPFIEEAFFRGYIFAGIRERRGLVFAAIATASCWSCPPLRLRVPAFTGIGFLFAWSYQPTGSIKPSIVTHAIINFTSLGIALLSSGIS
jgi:membrane protease YdiL (CAAX protease family)